jgi:hypothetical protein
VIADRLSIVDHHSRSGHRTSSPVIVRPISIRWISDAYSKMVKILAVGTVPQFSGLQTPVVSARIQHAPTEMNVGFGLAAPGFASGTNARREGPPAGRSPYSRASIRRWAAQ